MKPMFYVCASGSSGSIYAYVYKTESYKDAEQFCETYDGQAEMLEIRKMWVKK